ncbi:MAG: hypothetical protein HGA27_07345 [Peptococcaceae bacterium]|nr:hypothetical protein [Peptococcaceae bacterium]
MSNSLCHYCKNRINMETDATDKGAYFCSVRCFEKYLKNKSKKKLMIIGGSIILLAILCFSILSGYQGSWLKDRLVKTSGLSATDNPGKITKTLPDKVTVVGDKRFKADVEDALALIKKFDYPQYNLLIQFGWSIESASTTEENISAKAEKNKILIFKSFFDNTNSHASQRLAGIIVNKSTIALGLNRENNGLKPEDYQEMAIKKEVSFYRLVGAPDWMLLDALGRQETNKDYTIADGKTVWQIPLVTGEEQTPENTD